MADVRTFGNTCGEGGRNGGQKARPLPVVPGAWPCTPTCALAPRATLQGAPRPAPSSRPLRSHTLSADGPQRVHIVLVDELLL